MADRCVGGEEKLLKADHVDHTVVRDMHERAFDGNIVGATLSTELFPFDLSDEFPRR